MSGNNKKEKPKLPLMLRHKEKERKKN